MKYNTYKTLFYAGLLSFSVGFCMTSCEDYLDKSPESTVSEEDAFKNFRNFQGFIEEIYNCIPDKENVITVHLGIGVMMNFSILWEMHI